MDWMLTLLALQALLLLALLPLVRPGPRTISAQACRPAAAAPERVSVARERPSQQAVEAPSQQAVRAAPLKVAYAIVADTGVAGNKKWRDGVAVLARSLQHLARRSRHSVHVIAVLPKDVENPAEETAILAKLGVKARFEPVPVRLSEVQTEFGRQQLGLARGEKEQFKYFGAAFTEYDRVVILDGDTMFLHPIDEVFEDPDEHIRLWGINDYGMDVKTSAFPPINTGFLVYKPDLADFEGLADVFRQGDFRPGSGWQGSGTGWTYGTGSQGIVSFYYNMVEKGKPWHRPEKPVKGTDLPGQKWTQQPPTSRFRPMDRSVYDVFTSTELLEAFKLENLSISRIKHFHFCNSCPKPWNCGHSRDQICDAMTAQWWQFRNEWAQELGESSPPTKCNNGAYTPLPI